MAAAVDEARHLLNPLIRHLNRLQEIFAIIGVAYTSKLALKWTWELLSAFRTHVWARLSHSDPARYGQWAVVTGCTDGIGKAYCYLLAKRGMNLVLISRNMTKLVDVARDLESSYNIETHIIQVDFSDGKQIFPNIHNQIKDKDIGILVNNVGVMYEYPMLLEEVSLDTLWQHVLLNVGAVTMMTRLILPDMVKRGRGAIINMSSSSAIYPLPMMAVYSATKAYVDYFTRAIQHEYGGRGVDIQCIMPFYVSTAMTSFSGILHKVKFFVPNAPTFARHALLTLGHSKRTTGHWSHGLQYVLFGSMPEWMWLRLGYLLQKILRYDADVIKMKRLMAKRN